MTGLLSIAAGRTAKWVIALVWLVVVLLAGALNLPGKFGGAGFSADAIKVFEGINGTLLLAAGTLVFVLLILIYRSPFLFLIPLLAVGFAELTSRSVGYVLTELGVTV